MVGRATFADKTQVFEHSRLPDASQVTLGAPWDPNSPEWVIWEVQVPKFEVILRVNGVAMDRHGLILWENEATGSRKVFRYLWGLREAIF